MLWVLDAAGGQWDVDATIAPPQLGDLCTALVASPFGTGTLFGGFLSGLLAGRLRRTVEKGPRVSTGARLGLAFAGGALMGVGSKLARGCTSGQALTGGAVLNLGSWAFMMMVFAGAYALAWALRRQWR